MEIIIVNELLGVVVVAGWAVVRGVAWSASRIKHAWAARKLRRHVEEELKPKT